MVKKSTSFKLDANLLKEIKPLQDKELADFTKKHKKEIVLEDYEYFLCNLGTLTASEYRSYIEKQNAELNERCV